MSSRTRNAIRELLSSGSGKAGVLLLLIQVIIALYVVATFPSDFGLRVWNSPAAWADYPKAVPPAWTNVFDHRKVDHIMLEGTKPNMILKGDGTETRLYVFTVNYVFNEAPTFTSFTVSNIAYHSRPPVITVSITRPDNNELVLYRYVVPGPSPGEGVPVLRFNETPLRVYLSGNDYVVSAVSDFYRTELGVDIPPPKLRWFVESAIFGLPVDATDFKVLNGVYKINVKVLAYDPSDSVGFVRFVIGGSVYGLMGTDAIGRDLATGLVFGFPVALFIGLLTATLVTLMGSLTGIASGYIGGWTDTFIQRLADVLNNTPLLPILLFLTFILGQKLWIVILILIAFGWPGLTVVIRSMVLQIKSGQLVEATKALGASRWRIMLRHIFPQLAPFILAEMIFFSPAAILAEAGLSFLGLGDPSIPTWGQILEQGFRTGGVYVGYWWWILPPGLLIVLTAITFVLLALGMEAVVDPRLRKVR